MTSAYFERDGRNPQPPVGGSLLYLMMNLPLGIASFTALVTLVLLGLGTVIVWVGVPVLALLFLGLRGAARAERERVHSLLGAYVATPYRPLPESGQKARWKAQLTDAATYRDFTYFLLLLPLGITEFILLVTSWSVALGLVTLPISVRYVPGGAYYFPSKDVRWFVVDSTLDALPWAALGVLFVAVAVALTRVLGGLHARFARLVLGPGPRARRLAEGPVSEPEFPGMVA
ncbi:MAG TPA: sensor domain-containing protein [Amycolatopsis sp.]|uniref:sensor domain-containing protein n=1 Tax=Amycolatopsis sp. TaxID=37632 RepID=UPI002B48B084|nr:sensor domain-containing protein [Amycolatopsis sp.]HKS46842.1 sensor domain-containing protein [Amycolatopsis sp.]